MELYGVIWRSLRADLSTTKFETRRAQARANRLASASSSSVLLLKSPNVDINGGRSTVRRRRDCDRGVDVGRRNAGRKCMNERRAAGRDPLIDKRTADNTADCDRTDRPRASGRNRKPGQESYFAHSAGQRRRHRRGRARRSRSHRHTRAARIWIVDHLPQRAATTFLASLLRCLGVSFAMRFKASTRITSERCCGVSLCQTARRALEPSF